MPLNLIVRDHEEIVKLELKEKAAIQFYLLFNQIIRVDLIPLAALVVVHQLLSVFSLDARDLFVFFEFNPDDGGLEIF